jgi:hypothetical protein
VDPRTKGLLEKHWVHSHEEDTADEVVYRPSTHAFPRSRGRSRIELRGDGRYVEHPIGPADRPLAQRGTWELGDEQPPSLHLSPEKDGPRVLRIVSVGADRLVVKRERG